MKIVERYGVGYRIMAGRGVWAVLYPARLLLAGIYGLCVAARTGRKPSRGRRSLREGGGTRPAIISIGNIEAGGGGKTPCAVAVARGIAERGGLPVVITRGYRGLAQRRSPCVVSANGANIPARGAGFVTGEDLTRPSGAEPVTRAREAEVFGDEILIYRDRGISVIIDPRRGRGAELARRLFSPSHIILDDAFQNFSVAKDVDILLLDAEKPFGNGKLLPLGTLREYPRGTRRADVIIFTRAREKRTPETARRYVEGKSVYFADHEPSGLYPPERRIDSAPVPPRQRMRALLRHRPPRVIRADDPCARREAADRFPVRRSSPIRSRGHSADAAGGKRRYALRHDGKGPGEGDRSLPGRDSRARAARRDEDRPVERSA